MPEDDYREVIKLLMHKKGKEAEIRTLELVNTDNQSDEEFYWNLMILSELYRYKNEFKRSEGVLLNSLDLCKRKRFPTTLITRVYKKLGFLKYQLGEYHEAIDHFLSVLYLTQKNLKKKNQCYAYLLNCYYNLGKFEEFKQILHGAIQENLSIISQETLSDTIDFMWNCTRFATKEPWSTIIKEVILRNEQTSRNNTTRIIIEFTWARIYTLRNNYPDFLAHMKECKELYSSCTPDNIITLNIDFAAMLENPFGEYQRAIFLLLESLEYVPQPNTRRVYILNKLGSTLRFVGDYQKAIEFLNEALEISMNVTHNDWHLAYTHNTLGMIYTLQGKYKKAMEHYKFSLDYSNKIKDDISLAYTYGAIAWLESNHGNLKQAERYYKQAIILFEKQITTPAVILLAYAELISRFDEDNTRKIEDLISKAKNQIWKSKKRLDKGRYYNTIGYIALNTGLLNKAEDEFSKALEYNESFEVEGQTLLGITKVNLELFIQQEDYENLEKAKMLLNDLKLIAKSSALILGEVDLILGIIEMYSNHFSHAEEKFNHVLEHSQNHNLYSLEERTKKQLQLLNKFQTHLKLQEMIQPSLDHSKIQTNSLRQAIVYLNELTKVIGIYTNRKQINEKDL